MTLRECDCIQPEPHVKPGKSEWCVKCGGHLADRWRSSDANLQMMLERVADIVPNSERKHFDHFAAQIRERERAGRESFRYAYLARSNTREALEEAADYGLYLMLDSLQTIRKEGEDADLDLVLTGIHLAYRAHLTARQLAGKRRGEP